MSAPRWIDAAAFRAALPMRAAIDALEAAFAGGAASAPPRAHHGVPGGDLLIMPAAGPTGIGVKLVTVAPGNPSRGLPLISGIYVLFDATDLRPVALVDGAAITALRTAAVSGLAARHLARADARHLVVIGAGTQARSHIEALRAVLPIERVTVVPRAPGAAAALLAAPELDDLVVAEGRRDAVRDADVVATCTTSAVPVLRGVDLPQGVFVTAVGAYTPTARELDTVAMQRGRIVVEDRAAALAEGGDLCVPIAAGDLRAEDIVADLREVVRGAVVRRDDEDITVFKSVGLAIEDLAVVSAAAAALELG
jgi:ornithine cyclodeaminase/alanine dehydrogenase-like protein (mu-crystallin family)